MTKTTQKNTALKPISAQLDKFVQASFLLDERMPVEKENARGYMARALIQATLPHSDPGQVPLWGRRNGYISLSIQPGAYFDKRGNAVRVGLPFGSFPRIVLAMLTSEAVRTKSRRIHLGDSVTEFFKKLEGEERVTLHGGARGELTRFREQMKRLLCARIAVTYDDESKGFGFDFLPRMREKLRPLGRRWIAQAPKALGECLSVLIRRLLLLYILPDNADGRTTARGSKVAGRPEHAFPIVVSNVWSYFSQPPARNAF